MATSTIYVTSLRLTNAQARKIRGLARGDGLSMAQWLRRAVAEKLERETTPGDRELALNGETK